MASRKTDIRKLRPAEIYIVLEDLDFSWEHWEITRAIEMWQEGYDIRDISTELEREGDEVFLLLLDLARKGRINERDNGIFGRVRE